MTQRASVLLCLDSGTTAVKAAAFDRQGRMVASAEQGNNALRRDGVRVEQDMVLTRDDAFAVLKSCVDEVRASIDGILVTGQGDGLWAIDVHGEPVGPAITWLDGRTRALVTSLDEAGDLERIRLVTGSRPTTATQSLHLLWLAQNDPERLRRIAHALRLKEWLFYSLTGRLLADPSSVLPTWGSWRTGSTTRTIQEVLGLERGLEFLAELQPVGACWGGLSASASQALGLPAGLPVLQGPGDVQSTLIGLGLGTRPGVRRASIFGTSAIHAGHQLDAESVKEAPAGAMVLKFVLGPGYFCIHPCFNGATLMRHLGGLFGSLPSEVEPKYSSVIVHPFFEPGGERAPYTTPYAAGAFLGMTAQTSVAEIAWAACESLAFIARISHDMMDISTGSVALGGGLAGSRHFSQLFATVIRAPVLRSADGHASLRGLAAIGARFLYDAPDHELSALWIGAPDETLAPQKAAIASYAESKFQLFARSIDIVAPAWATLTEVREQAASSARDL
jgi:erythritol kinase (D-erythritol 1-phosphate-forming)